ncbi:hypothetical protein PLESTM_000204000 [Pleodorina starrii]|nr:hypothetical protein PLESTM_000204000 [Pleodorina starrii]
MCARDPPTKHVRVPATTTSSAAFQHWVKLDPVPHMVTARLVPPLVRLVWCLNATHRRGHQTRLAAGGSPQLGKPSYAVDRVRGRVEDLVASTWLAPYASALLPWTHPARLPSPARNGNGPKGAWGTQPPTPSLATTRWMCTRVAMRRAAQSCQAAARSQRPVAVPLTHRSRSQGRDSARPAAKLCPAAGPPQLRLATEAGANATRHKRPLSPPPPPGRSPARALASEASAAEGAYRAECASCPLCRAPSRSHTPPPPPPPPAGSGSGSGSAPAFGTPPDTH